MSEGGPPPRAQVTNAARHCRTKKRSAQDADMLHGDVDARTSVFRRTEVYAAHLAGKVCMFQRGSHGRVLATTLGSACHCNLDYV